MWRGMATTEVGLDSSAATTAAYSAAAMALPFG
jgi:hypothetical protein